LERFAVLQLLRRLSKSNLSVDDGPQEGKKIDGAKAVSIETKAVMACRLAVTSRRKEQEH
jgi:hypothetical protein